MLYSTVNMVLMREKLLCLSVIVVLLMTPAIAKKSGSSKTFRESTSRESSSSSSGSSSSGRSSSIINPILPLRECAPMPDFNCLFQFQVEAMYSLGRELLLSLEKCLPCQKVGECANCILNNIPSAPPIPEDCKAETLTETL